MNFRDLVIPELINLVASKCDLQTLDKLSSASNNIKNMIDDDIKIKKIKEIIPEFLHKYINFNSKFMLNSKNIDIGDRFGFTGYIDFIRPENFINENYKTNIIYGYDNINRFFISILYKDLLNDETKIVTFFQRYSSDTTYYVSCQNTFIMSGWCATFRFTNNAFEKLTIIYEIMFRLINEGVATNDIHSEEKYNYILL